MLTTQNNAIVVKDLDTPAKFVISSLSARNVLRNTLLQIAILKSRIVCTCANCDVDHPASFTGCPKKPLNINKRFPSNNKTNTKTLTRELNNQLTLPPKMP